MSSSSSWATSAGKPGDVGEFKVIKDMPKMEEALELLKKLHSLCKPIQKKYGWYLPTLTEFFPSNPNLLGMNQNRGKTILIRLRPAHDKSSFLPLEESLVGTLLHEFTHNVHAPHHKQFYEFLDKLQDEYDVLRTSGYTGEGFLSEGRRAGCSRDVPAYLAKQKALQGAKKREQIYNVMGPAGGSRLGASKSTLGKTPKQMAAEAAERRALDDKACGHGEAVSDKTVQEEVEKAAQQSTTLGNTSFPSNQAGLESSEPSRPRQPREGSSNDSDIEIVETSRPSTSISSSRRPMPTTGKPAPAKRTRTGQDVGNITTSAEGRAGTTWVCEICTFENDKLAALACDMCARERFQNYQPENIPTPSGTSRTPAAATGSSGSEARETVWTCHLCGADTDNQWWTCRLCGHLKLSSS